MHAYATLGDLVAFCNRRGPSWWRSIPRIGRGRARAIVSWLRKQQAKLQLTVDIDVDSTEHDGVPLVADELVEVVPNFAAERSEGRQPGRLTLAPLERLAVPHSLSGAKGENRSTAFCYIQANTTSMRCARI
ncbi:phage integrase family protein [Caballeronia sp. LZ031]|nr:phage integrase family protein [Caballeronia sp. LZ031]